MTEHEEIIIYDTMVQIRECAPILCQLLNERATPAESDAYKRGIYAAVVRLDSLFTQEQRAAHEERHRKIKEECDAFFAAKANAKDQAPEGLPAWKRKQDEECAKCAELEDACPECARKIHESWHEQGMWWIRAEECHDNCPGRLHPIVRPAAVERKP